MDRHLWDQSLTWCLLKSNSAEREELFVASPLTCPPKGDRFFMFAFIGLR
jgi:hypothetical protein